MNNEKITMYISSIMLENMENDLDAGTITQMEYDILVKYACKNNEKIIWDVLEEEINAIADADAIIGNMLDKLNNDVSNETYTIPQADAIFDFITMTKKEIVATLETAP